MALCVVSGTIETILGVAVNSGTVVFQLTNFSNAVPHISGQTLLVPTPVAIPIASDGTFSVSLEGNDLISPSNTLYAVTYQTTEGAFGPYLYSITGSAVNLDSAIPVGTPAAPQFDSPFKLVIPTGAIDGVNVTFTLPSSTSAGQLVLVFAGGVLQNPGASNDYVISGATITFNVPPVVSPILVVY